MSKNSRLIPSNRQNFGERSSIARQTAGPLGDIHQDSVEGSVARENVYRSGTAAKQLGISSYHLRRLCETGLVNAEITASGQWLVPVSEVARLREGGIPPVPQDPPDEADDSPGALLHKESSRRREPYAGMSERVLESAEDVEITRNRLRKRALDWRGEELEDRFRERDQQQARRKAALEETQRQRKAEEEARRRLLDWRNSWHRYATNSMPNDVTPEVRLDLPDCVNEALEKTDPSQPASVTRSLVDAAIDKALRPWQHQSRIESTIKTAIAGLPWAARGIAEPTEWEVRAAQSARQALRQLEDSAPLSEMEVVASQAVGAIVLEFEHSKTCGRLVSRVYLPDATIEEQRRARETVAQQLGNVAVGTPESLMKEQVERILEPLRAQVRHREDEELRVQVIRWAPLPSDISEAQKHLLIAGLQKVFTQLPEGTPQRALEEIRDRALAPFLAAHELQKKKARLIEIGRRAVFQYLLKHNKELPPGRGVCPLSDELKEPITKKLAQELTGDESTGVVEDRVGVVVREHLRQLRKAR